MTPGLPYEIEEQIVDHLHDDPTALRACSLTCSAWVPRARLHLFRTAALTCKRCCVRFLAVLESTAETEGGTGTSVGEFVRELYLPSFSLYQRGRQEGLRYEMVCQICRRLPNVTVLVIDRFDWPRFIDRLCPGGNAANIRGALTSVFRFPHLQQLRMRTLSYGIPGDALQLISSFPNLTALELVGLTGSSRDADDPPLALVPYGERCTAIRLQELIVDKWSSSIPALRDMLESLLKPPFELRLRKLHWKTGDANEDMVRDPLGAEEKVLTKLFHGARETLEEFSLNVQRDRWLEQPEHTISGHHSLSVLTLIFRLPQSGAAYWPFIPGFISKVESTALREVNLHFLSPRYDLRWDFVDWDSVSDALITLHEKHPWVLITFRFSVYISLLPMPSVAAPLRERIQRALKKGVRVVAFREGLGVNYIYNPSMPGVVDRASVALASTRTEL